MKNITIYFGNSFSATTECEDDDAAKLIDAILQHRVDWVTINGPERAQSIRVSSIMAFDHDAKPRPKA